MNNVIMLMNQWQDKIPPAQAFIIQEQLEEVDESSLYSLVSLDLKSPIIGFVLGFLLGYFGADRFYKGDIWLGVAKLLFCWLTFGVWWLADLFLVWKGIKNDNVAKIAQALAFAKKKQESS